MMNDVEASIWTRLESDPGSTGWRLIRWRRDPGISLYAAHDPERRRVILLPTAAAKIPPLSKWPRCAGLEPAAVAVGGEPHVGVTLKETRYSDVFDALGADLARRVELAGTNLEALTAFLGQLSRWQRFLAAPSEGLSAERQRGLWGELHFLVQHLVPTIGLQSAVRAWKGGAAAHQDFQMPTGAVEVKTTAAKQPQSVIITSERQLDGHAFPVLGLFVAVLEMHDGTGISLPAMIEKLRTLAGPQLELREEIDNAVLEAGYLDVHADRYAGVGYTLRVEHCYQVGPGFPRLVEADLPPGVGDTRYALSLAACTPFAVEPFAFLSTLTETP